MISQRLRNFKLGTLHQTKVTGFAGMALLLTFAQDLGLGKEFDRLFSHLKQRQRGYSVSSLILTFLQMIIQSGDRLNDPGIVKGRTVGSPLACGLETTGDYGKNIPRTTLEPGQSIKNKLGGEAPINRLWSRTIPGFQIQLAKE